MVELVELLRDGSEVKIPCAYSGTDTEAGKLPGLQLLPLMQRQRLLAIEWKPRTSFRFPTDPFRGPLTLECLDDIGSTLGGLPARVRGGVNALVVDEEMCCELPGAEAHTPAGNRSGSRGEWRSPLKRCSLRQDSRSDAESCVATADDHPEFASRKRAKVAIPATPPQPCRDHAQESAHVPSRKRHAAELENIENIESFLGEEFERLLLSGLQRKVLCRRATA